MHTQTRPQNTHTHLQLVIGLLHIGHAQGMESRRNLQSEASHPLGFLQHGHNGRMKVRLQNTLLTNQKGYLQRNVSIAFIRVGL